MMVVLTRILGSDSGLLQGHQEGMWRDLATTGVATTMVRVGGASCRKRLTIVVATLVVARSLDFATALGSDSSEDMVLPTSWNKSIRFYVFSKGKKLWQHSLLGHKELLL